MKDSDKVVQEKIDSIQNVPDGNFDYEATWSKLHMRLGDKTTAKSYWLYYSMAASLLLLCFTIVFLFIQKKESHIQPSVNITKKSHKDTVTNTTPSTHSIAIEVHTQPAKPKLLKQRTLPVNITKPRIIEPVTFADSITITNDTLESEPKYVAKKMKVLHINNIREIPQHILPQPQNSIITIADHHQYKNYIPPITKRTEFVYEINKRFN